MNKYDECCLFARNECEIGQGLCTHKTGEHKKCGNGRKLSTQTQVF
uniref:Uncharacterized protein n=1 Tax=Anguilla anguilla TaxID=7936 RepID=A0A0E9SWJ5_ANGAN